MFKLLHNCIHLTRQQSNAQNSKPSFNSTRTMNFQMYKLDLEKAGEPEIKLPTSPGSKKIKGILEKHLLLFHWLR